jgi:TonB family protein
VRRAVVGLVVAIALSACSGSRSRSPTIGSGDVPAYPTDFVPPPPLGDPPAGDPAAYGRPYLDAIYRGGVKEAWTQFLEECRLRLPPAHPLNQPTLATVVDVVIDPRGALLDVKVAEAGNADFDSAALDVMRDRAPYPPPPPPLLSDDGNLHLQWRFARDVRQAGPGTAEVERVEWPAERAVARLLAEQKVGSAARRLLRAGDVAGRRGTPTGKFIGSDLGSDRAELAESIFVAALVEAMARGDLPAQRAAAIAAGRIRLVAAAPALRSLATAALDPDTRAAALIALGEIGDADGVTMALDVLGKGPVAGPVILAAAATAIDRAGAAERARPIIAAWLSAARAGDANALSASLSALAIVPAGDLLPAITEALAKTGARERAAGCAVYGRAATWPQLRTGLGDADASVRAACADAVVVAARVDGKRSAATGAVYSALRLRLRDPDRAVQASAIGALVALDAARAANDLSVVAKATDRGVLAALIAAWGALLRPPVGRIIPLAGHADAAVRAAAVRVLAHRKDATSLAEASLRAGDRSEAVRLAAIPAIRAEKVLRALARDASPAVRAAAGEALVALRGRAAAIADQLEALATAEPAGVERVSIAAAWLLAR